MGSRLKLRDRSRSSLFVTPIEFHTRRDIVYEPFNLSTRGPPGRLHYATEQAPRYCDVAKARWKAFSGQRAVRE